MKNIVFLGCILVFSSIAKAQSEVDSAKAQQLFQQINAYRKSLKLSAIPQSPKLTKVAELHAKDLSQHPPEADCNLHSWSAHGSWKPCCYTRDHANAACMWDKPKEIAGYQGQGFEIAHRSTAGATPEGALSGWKRSPGHHEVMINKGQWSRVEWKAMGVAVFGEYAVVWFGMLEDD